MIEEMEKLQPYQLDDAAVWDAFVLKHGGGFLQSWDWSVFQEALGRTAYRFRIGAADAGEPAAQFLAVRHGLPFGQSYVYVPRGPIVAATASADDFLAVLQSLRLALPQIGCLFARMDLPKETVPQGWSGADLTAAGLLPNAPYQPAETVVVDLGKDESGLSAALHSKTRYNIRVAERHGVTVREADYGNAHGLRGDLRRFWRLMRETTERDGFSSHPQSHYEKMIEALSPRQGRQLQVRLFLAENGGETAAAALVAEFGGVGTYLHGASSARHRAVMAPQLLHWRIMLELKKRGLRQYDLHGVAPVDAPENHPWAGITRFKMGFGGERVSYPGTWELTVRPFWYKLYRLARDARRMKFWRS